MHVKSITIAICSVLLMFSEFAYAASPQKVVVFDLELIDSSLGGELSGHHPEEARLKKLDAALRAAYTANANYRLLDETPERQAAAATHLQSCGGCDVDMGKALGADLVVTGEVQKVSDMLANMTIHVRGTSDGRQLAGGTTALQGNSDDVWMHGLKWLIRNRLLPAAQ